MSHSVCISAADYGDGAAPPRQFVAGFDLESVPGAEASGIPVQGGGTVQINLKNISDGTTQVKKAYISTHYDAVLELKSQGAIVYSSRDGKDGSGSSYHEAVELPLPYDLCDARMQRDAFQEPVLFLLRVKPRHR